MPSSTPAPLLLTMADVAALARVQRPVVSVWRSRFAMTEHPFPNPAPGCTDRQVFRMDEVVEWLEETGHGNNRAPRQDAAVDAALDLLPDEARSETIDGLLALLALRARLDTPLEGLTSAELIDLVDDVDPDDHAIYREVVAMGPDVTRWAAHADDLASAAYTTAGAVQTLTERHRRLGFTDVSAHTFSPTALDLVARLAAELSAHHGASRSLVVPFGDADLLAALARHEQDAGVVALPDPVGPAARHARRLLLAQGWSTVPVEAEDGLALPPQGATVLIQLPSPTRPGLSDDDVVSTLTELEATLPTDGLAIVLGPASALCGRLPGSAQSARATVLRSGRVRAIAHLPVGLWPAQSRRGLAVWVLGPGVDDVRSPRHRTAVTDLRASAWDSAAIDDALADLVVASDHHLRSRAHTFRFTRLVVTTGLTAASGALVGRSAGSHRPRTSAAEALQEIAALSSSIGIPLPGVPPLLGRPGGGDPPAVVTVDQLIALGHLVVVQGNRLHDDDLSADNGVGVHTTATVTGGFADPPVMIDRLLLAADYPRSRYTRPGDIVFTTSPHPAAVLDGAGLCVVAAPARVLRVSPTAPAGLLPQVLVHAITRAPRTGDWRSWPVPLVPGDDTDALRGALEVVAGARAATAERVAALDSLTTRLVEAVTSGSVSLLEPTPRTPMEG